MGFKAGDKIILSNVPNHIEKMFKYKKDISGIVIRQCAVGDCLIVELSNSQVRHLRASWLSPAGVKNQQLLFSFME